MKKFLSILLSMIALLTLALTMVACGDNDDGGNEPPTTPPSEYAEGYLVKIRAVQRGGDEEDFSANIPYADVIVLYGESLGENLPDLTQLREELKNDFEDLYWSASVNGNIVKIEKDTVLNFENLGIDKGNAIILKISCKSFWSDFD